MGVGVSSCTSHTAFVPELTFSLIFSNQFGTHCCHDALVCGDQHLHHCVKELGKGREGRGGEGKGGEGGGWEWCSRESLT